MFLQDIIINDNLSGSCFRARCNPPVEPLNVQKKFFGIFRYGWHVTRPFYVPAFVGFIDRGV